MKNSFVIGVLGSGKGSNFRAIMESIQAGRLNAKVRLVISDVPDAGILAVAREFQVPAVYVPPGKFRTKLEPEVEADVVKRLQGAGVELIVLAGFMRLVRTPLLRAFPRRIINIHPSLLPKYRGLEAWKQALAAGETLTGCTVHYVDEGMDTGEIIAQRQVPVLPGDTPGSLHARIQAAEHALLPDVIARLAEERARR
jgi:phosphoribosylglycinamide formyltransferase 1